jgi:medium-chain acyl-[acyl-carrier-protein] hydrolase
MPEKLDEPSPIEPPVWSEQIQIRSYDVDATRRATILSLFRHFLEAAWNHAENLGFGFAHLGAQGKFWVLSRLRIEVTRYPVWGAQANLRTWPRGIQSLFALREFEFVDESNQRLAAGSSAWLVVDSISKRPQRLLKLLPNLASFAPKPALGQDPEKLEDNESWDSESPITARYTDIDVNNHVTAARYLGWIIDSYPAGFHAQNSLHAIDVNYLSETIEGEQLIVRTRQTGPNVFLHSLTKSNGAEVCRARLEWSIFTTKD